VRALCTYPGQFGGEVGWTWLCLLLGLWWLALGVVDVAVQVLEERSRKSNGWGLVEQASCTVSIAGLQVRRKKYSSLNASPTDRWRRLARCLDGVHVRPRRPAIRQSNLSVARSAASCFGPP
jgi:uncharacterized membrane protein